MKRDGEPELLPFVGGDGFSSLGRAWSVQGPSDPRSGLSGVSERAIPAMGEHNLSTTCDLSHAPVKSRQFELPASLIRALHRKRSEKRVREGRETMEMRERGRGEARKDSVSEIVKRRDESA